MGQEKEKEKETTRNELNRIEPNGEKRRKRGISELESSFSVRSETEDQSVKTTVHGRLFALLFFRQAWGQRKVHGRGGRRR